MTPAEIGGLTTGIIGLFLTLLAYASKIASRVSALETKVALFWHIIEEGAATLLHRDDTPEIDALLEKARETELTEAERDELVRYLKGIETDKTRPQGDKAMALIYRAALIARYDG